MKKNIIILLSLLLIVLVVASIYFILKNNGTEQKEIKKQISNNSNNVICVRVKEETEAGYTYYKTQDKDLIIKLVNAIDKIKIGEKVDIVYNDNGKTYIFEREDGTTLSYYFQGNYYNKDNVNYKTYNYEELNKIKVPKEIIK